MALGELKEVDPESAKQYSTSNEKTEETASGEYSTETATPSPSSVDGKDMKNQVEDEEKGPK